MKILLLLYKYIFLLNFFQIIGINSKISEQSVLNSKNKRKLSNTNSLNYLINIESIDDRVSYITTTKNGNGKVYISTNTENTSSIKRLIYIINSDFSQEYKIMNVTSAALNKYPMITNLKISSNEYLISISQEGYLFETLNYKQKESYQSGIFNFITTNSLISKNTFTSLKYYGNRNIIISAFIEKKNSNFIIQRLNFTNKNIIKKSSISATEKKFESGKTNTSVTCFEFANYIECLYTNSNHLYTVSIFDIPTLVKIYDKIIDTNEVLTGHLFSKCIHVKGSVGAFIYFTNDDQFPKLQFKNFESNDNEYILSDYINEVDIINLNSLGSFPFKSYYIYNDLIKIDENNFIYISSGYQEIQLYILFIKLLNDDKNILMNYYILKLNENIKISIYKDFNLFSVNKFIGIAMTHNNYDLSAEKTYSSLLIFGYLTFKSEINITISNNINIFDEERNYTIRINEIIEKVEIKNNLFGYEAIGIKLISYLNESNTGFYLYSNINKKKIEVNELVYENDSISFKLVSSLGAKLNNYSLDYEIIIKEPEFDDFISYAGLVEYFPIKEENNKDSYKSYYQPNFLSGRQSYINFSINECFNRCQSCSYYGDNLNHHCDICSSNYPFTISITNGNNCFQNEEKITEEISNESINIEGISSIKEDNFSERISTIEEITEENSTEKSTNEETSNIPSNTEESLSDESTTEESTTQEYLSDTSTNEETNTQEYLSDESNIQETIISENIMEIININSNIEQNSEDIEDNNESTNETNINIEIKETEEIKEIINIENNCKKKYYIDDNLKINCIDSDICINEYPYADKNSQNLCTNCAVKYKNKCYSVCPENTCIKQDIYLDTCIDIDSNTKVINEICFENFQNLTNNIKEMSENNIIINNIPNLTVYAYDIEKNASYFEDNNLTYIYFKDIQDNLIQEFNLDNNSKIFVLIVDSISKYSNSTINDYGFVLFLENGTELNLSTLSEELKVKISVPIQNLELVNYDYATIFSQQGYDIYDRNNKFYHDLCTPGYLHDNDLTLENRRKEIYINYISYEKSNCEYQLADLKNKRFIYNCYISEINKDNTNNNVVHSFDKKRDEKFINYILDVINYKIIVCYKLFINIDNFRHNKAVMICTTSNFIAVLLFIIFFCSRLPKLRVEIYHMTPTKSKIRNLILKQKLEKSKKSIVNISNPIRKDRGKERKNSKKSKLGNSKSNSRDSNLLFTRIILSQDKNSHKKNSNSFNNSNNILFEKRKIKKLTNRTLLEDIIEKNIKDLDDLPFILALKLEKRNIFKIFIIKLTEKIKVIDNCVNKKIKEISFSQYFLYLLIDLTTNSMLYCDKIVSHKSHNNGKLDFLVSISLSAFANILASIIGYYLNLLVGFEEKIFQVEEIKNEINYLKFSWILLREMKIRVIIFFFCEIALIIFCSYYLFIFFTIYHKSQMSLLKSFLISRLEILIINIVMAIFIAVFRKLGIYYKNKYIYNISKYLDKNF